MTSDSPFSSARLHTQLEALRLAFEKKQHSVTKSLLPPIPEGELRARCAWFPTALPDEIVALYGWRGGQANDPWGEEFPFWFRDCGFCSPTRAAHEYHSMMESYGTNPDCHDLLKYSFPFAAFNGGWLVLPCRTQSLDIRLARPVITVHLDISIHYHCIETMLATCVAWVSSPAYRPGHSLPEDIERRIWHQHNPQVFD